MTIANKKGFDPSDLSLENIQVVKSHIDQQDYWKQAESGNRPSVKSYAVKMANETGFNTEHHAGRIRLYIEITGLAEDEQPAGIKGDFILDFHFRIYHTEKYFIQDKENSEVDAWLAANMMSVAYATARGIIWQLTAPTLLGGVIMPVIDAMKFLEQGKREKETDG